MKKIIVPSIFIFTLVFYSCNNTANNNELDITQNVMQIKGNLLSLDCLVGRPMYINCVDDTLLVFYDRYEGKLFTVFDIKNNKCVGRFVTEGNGPNEVLPPIRILQFPQKEKLYVFNEQTRYLYSFDIPAMNLQNKILFQDLPIMSYLGELKDYYVAIGNWQDGRFGIYNREGNLLRTEGEYPFSGEKMNFTQRFFTYQGHVSANPNGNCFVLGCSYSDNLEFYEVKENETILLKQYGSYDAKTQYHTSDNAQGMSIEDDCIISYTWSHSTNKYCYMLYSGKRYSETKPSSSGGNKIVVFDWEGNYIKTLESAIRIMTFCVDENDSCIYAAVRADDGEIKIMHFNIEI